MQSKNIQPLDKSIDLAGEISYDDFAVNEELKKILTRKIEFLRSQLAAFETALRAAHRDDNPEAEGAILPSEQVEVYHASYAEIGTKSHYVAQMIQTSQASGVTAAEIRKRARKDGISVNAAFPYSNLKRMVERGEAVERDGWYFPGKEKDVVRGKNSRTTSETKTGER